MKIKNDLLIAIEKRVALGLVRKATLENLSIYNYTPECIYSKSWDNITKQCRGLIIDSEGNIIARGFTKFFNLDEMPDTSLDYLINNVDCKDIEISDKLDGSLGIGYWIDKEINIATRGAFKSVQAVKATTIARNKYKEAFNKLHSEYPELTPLFEIIYKENRIVINYGDFEDLILIGFVNCNSGKELSYYETVKLGKQYNFNCVNYKIGSLEDALAIVKENKPNFEGVVLRFNNGVRIKCKTSEYLRLHRIVTGLSEKYIWRYLSTNQSIKTLTESVPEEFQKYINKVCEDLRTKYKKIEDEARDIVNTLPENATQKEKALIIRSSGFYLTNVCFNMINNKDYSLLIWRYLEPKGIDTKNIEDI